MECNYKIIRFFCLLIPFILCTSLNPKEYNCEESDTIKVCFKKIKDKKRKEIFMLITYENLKNNITMDSIFYNNALVFQYYAKDSIYAVTEDLDTIKPFSYIFEDRFDLTIPYYKQIVGFKKNKSNYKELVIKNCGIHHSFKLN